MSSIESRAKSFLDKIKKEDKKINSFLHLNPQLLEQAKVLDKKQKKGKLYGKIIAVKSNINVKGLITNCASIVLENYVAPYDATVIQKIKSEDGLIIGMTNMDEFALGSAGENSAFGPTHNPAAPGRVTGGTSSGSAAAVAAGFCDIALGSDTGGSCRTPASHCGIVGLKPSYGAVSRYGLIDSAMSFDQIGILASTMHDVKQLFEIIAGKDERDTTTLEIKKDASLPKKLTLGTLHIQGVDAKIQKLIDTNVEKIAKKYNCTIRKIDIKHIDLAVQTYYPIQYAEFFSATRRFDGRRYGKKIEDACGPEVLRRILGGAHITKAEHAGRYYFKALQVKDLITKEFESVFKTVDCIMLPTVPGLPWKIGEGDNMPIEQVYAYDALTIPANLAGICALSMPAGTIEKIPVGLQIMCARGSDAQLLSIAQMVEEVKV